MNRICRLRNDLQIVRLPAGEGVRVRDPLDARCFQFSEEQWRGLERLASFRDLRDWVSDLVRRDLNPGQAARGWSMLLARVGAEGLLRGGRDWRTSPPRGPAWWATPWAIRLGAIPAERLTSFLYTFARVLFHPALVIGWACGILLTMLIALGFASRLVSETTTAVPMLLQQAPWLLPLSLVAVKVCHELGHALVARHVGGGCREVGLMLFVGSPCLYADVTECWMVPERSRRVLVTLGGTAVEAALAAAAFWLWLMTVPGVLHATAWFVIMIVVLGNLALNLNPLMRYDGYYLLSDLWGIPNLHQHARAAARRQWRDWWLGAPMNRERLAPSDAAGASNNSDAATAADPETQQRPQEPVPARTDKSQGFDRTHWGLVGFATAAWCYRLLVVLLIVGGLVWLASPYGLGWLAAGLGGIWLATGFGIPLLVAFARLGDDARRMGRKGRFVGGGLCLLAVVAVIALWPLPTRVSGVGSVRWSDAQPIYATEDSSVEEIARSDETILANETVFRLRADDLEWQATMLEAELAETNQELELAQRLVSDSSTQSIGALRSRRDQLLEEQAVLAGRRERLSAHSESRTRLVPNHQLASPVPSDGQLPTWHGDPSHPSNRGATVTAGTLLGWLVPEQGSWEVWARIDERDLPRVVVGAEASIQLGSGGWAPIAGRVVEVGLANGQESRLEGETWGDWLARVSAGQSVERRVAWVKIEAAREARFPGASSDLASATALPIWHDEPARIGIAVGSESLASRAWRWGSRQFHWAW